MRHPYFLASSAILAATALLSPDAGAVRQSPGLRAGLELAGGAAARPLRTVTGQVPRGARRGWLALQHDLGGRWLASWDEATGVPSRIFGTGVPAFGAIASPTAAEKIARTLLARHLALLAPGAAISDLLLVSNERAGDRRTVAFAQYTGGMRVLSGQLSFRFEHDAMVLIASEALPQAQAAPPDTVLDEAAANKRALEWLLADRAKNATVRSTEGPFVLPIVTAGSVAGYRTVVRVTLDSTGPTGRWQLYLDAQSGQPVARQQTLRFATATVLFDAPVRYPLSNRQDYPAKFAGATINGSSVSADPNGVLSFPDGGPVDATVTAQGPLVAVSNAAGTNATTVLTLDPGGSATWSAPDDEPLDAQLSAFIHAQLAKDFARTIAPQMSWLDAKLPVKVNVNDTCNAFYDGSALNFFHQTPQCENTARLADVVYHEFGHGFHHHSIVQGSGQFDEALSEGLSDYFAAAYTGDPGMGRGFFFSNQPLRQIDPQNGEHVWPTDISPDPHETGLIIAGALWDLRKALQLKYGDSEGADTTNQLFYQSIKNAADIPSMYAEVLAADDDDGNLENGTPNACEIVEAFGKHGLRTINVVADALSIAPPTQDGYQVTLKVEGLFDVCPGDEVSEADLVWRLRSNPNEGGTIIMSGGPTDFVGQIPAQDDGQVVNFRVDVNLAIGSQLSYPDNPADPMYEMFVGQVTPIYCTDFETDPAGDGWTHGLLSGANEEGADDWQWDTPNGTSSNGDPSAAYSGTMVFGNDLGHGNYNGMYQPNKTNYADSPVVDVSGHDHVRLQYRRWLNVEDGYYDHATIYVGGQQAWQNLASPTEDATVHHTDREWRFHDIDLDPYLGADGTVQIRYELESDQGLQLGGWTLDDFCIVSYEPAQPAGPECGNGLVEVGEQCDDGNLLDGDGCDSGCQSETSGQGGGNPGAPGPVVIDDGCGCRTAGRRTSAPYWLLLPVLGAGALRRRRRAGRRRR